MTEQEAHTVAGAVTNLGGRLLSALPAQFLLLLLINVVFLMSLIWFLDRRDAARERLLTPILAACLQQAPPRSP